MTIAITSSSIPNAIDQFLAIITVTLAEQTDVQVIDFEPRGNLTATKYVEVKGAEARRTPATLGDPRFQIEEEYTIVGMIRSYVGENNISSTRTDVFVIQQLIENAVRANPTLNGSVRVCWFESLSLESGILDKGGSGSELAFGLHCEYRST